MKTKYISNEDYNRLRGIEDNLKKTLKEYGGSIISWYDFQTESTKDSYKVSAFRAFMHDDIESVIALVDGEGVVHNLEQTIQKFWDEEDEVSIFAIQHRIESILPENSPKDAADEKISKKIFDEENFTLSVDGYSAVLLYKGKIYRHCSLSNMEDFVKEMIKLING